MQEEKPQDSQQEPTEDSGLQTPQPDQPMPTESERAEQQDEPSEPGDDSAADQE